MIKLEPTVLAGGHRFGEGPRWHDGALWFASNSEDKVFRCWPDGRMETVLELPRPPDSPGHWGPQGLGFMPDGSLLIVMMSDLKLMRYKDGEVSLHADLRGTVDGILNDLVVDRNGRAYVGETSGGAIVLVEPDGHASVVTTDIEVPNGMTISEDGTTLVVTHAHEFLIAWAIQPDGSLTNRRVWADLSLNGVVRRRITQGNLDVAVVWSDIADSISFCDGIGFDAEGAIWVAGAFTEKFMRVLPGGTVTHIVPTPGRSAIACVLGGDDGRTLFMLTTELAGEPRAGDILDVVLYKVPRGETNSFVETAYVDVPHAGIP